MIRRAGLLAAMALVAACGRGADVKASGALQPDGGHGVMPVASAHVRVSARASDPTWQRARGGDAIALVRLADMAGAAELLEGVDDGGDVRRTALLALPHADDADLALGHLADVAMVEATPSLGDVLDAMLAIAARPRDQREPLDPEGMQRAAGALLTIAARADLAPEDRAVALSAARALAEKGYGDAARIPP
jgi:hypothetical protein